MTERILLPRVPREIAALTGQTAPTYRRIYIAALDGRIPAVLEVNGRWTVARADLAVIADTLGVSASQVAA